MKIKVLECLCPSPIDRHHSHSIHVGHDDRGWMGPTRVPARLSEHYLNVVHITAWIADVYNGHLRDRFRDREEGPTDLNPGLDISGRQN